MNLLFPLTHLEAPLSPEWSRPLGLMVAGNGTVIEQMLFSTRKYLRPSAIFFGSERAAQVAAAVDIPHRLFAHGPCLWPALRHSRTEWQSGPVLLTLGDAVIDADLSELEQQGADAVCFVHPPDPDQAGPALDVRDGLVTGVGGVWRASGLWWFRHGATLADALADLPDSATAGELTVALLRCGATISSRQSDLRAALTGSEPPAERLLTLNHRLLGFGRSSDNAIERGYGEDFTVLTPVYIDESATIDCAVVGPYTSIGPGATVRGSIVRNSIIGPAATVEDAVLDGAIIGKGAAVMGQRWSPRAADGSTIMQTA